MIILKINPVISQELKDHNNILSAKRANELGFSRALLSTYVKKGLLERCAPGIYSRPDTVHDDMYILMLHSKKIIFSHESALYLNGLSDRTPFVHTFTIPSDSALPASIKGTCNCFYIKPELHSLGLTARKTVFGNEVRCYNAERTLCDIFRSRNKLDQETFLSSIKNYAAYKNKDLNLLGDYSKQFHIYKELKKYLEVLL
jgi:predicted transcriptional regulator of viral defense system